jgi:choline dehydrogenase-like flavoprotein
MRNIVDARSVPENETIDTDVCVVGAGIAGITLAREFIGRGFQVCLLESGDLKLDRETQSLCRGDSTGHPYFPLHEARARYFGGSANFWEIDIGNNRIGARLRPLDPIDFEERKGIPYSGWPFRKPDIDPFYERAQIVCQVEPATYDLEDWEDPEKAPRLPLVPGRVNTVIFKFGWQDVFTRDYPYEITHRADNVLTFLFANVIEIETHAAARTVRRLRVACLAGTKFWVAAKIFILAAGGIETPRLLLLSNKAQNVGLGNQHDLVGRYFMEHLHFTSGIFVPAHARVYESAALYSGVRKVGEVPVIGKLALTEELLRREGLLNQNIQLIPRFVSNADLYSSIVSKGTTSLQTVRSAIHDGYLPKTFGGLLRNIVTDLDTVGISAYRKMRRDIIGKFSAGEHVRAFRLAHMAEQTPNPDSRVSLVDERDCLGLNRVRLNWQLSPFDILSTVRTQRIIGEEFRRAGLGRLFIQHRDATPPPDLHGGYHHMGTTRMHRDPRKGVVDENCRVHGISNLFIAGPSVFPTGGYANPTLTTVALAVRLADHVKRTLG